MLTYDLLNEITNGHLYDLTDILIKSGVKNHFNSINTLYLESLQVTGIMPYSYWTIGFNMIMTLFLLQAKYQFESLFTDKEYRILEMVKQGKTNEKEFLKSSKEILQLYHYLPYVNLMQLLWSFKNQFYLSEAFYHVYKAKIIAYILEQQALGNLDEELINQIVNLIS